LPAIKAGADDTVPLSATALGEALVSALPLLHEEINPMTKVKSSGTRCFKRNDLIIVVCLGVKKTKIALRNEKKAYSNLLYLLLTNIILFNNFSMLSYLLPA